MTNGNDEKEKRDSLPKKFLFVSAVSLSGDLAWKLKNEGHEVKIYIKSEEDKDVYEGFLERVEKWEDHKEWADIIVFDYVGWGKIADALRKEGKFVVGGSEYTDKLEEDREFGQNEMKKTGMTVLPHWDFTDFDAAVDFIKTNPGRYVFKPSGAISSNHKGILFLGEDEDGRDLINILEQNKKLWAKKIKRFLVQKLAEGVEIAVGAFFNGEEFVYPINVNFEHKKLFPGDIGPYTAEMGTLMYWSEPNAIFTATLFKMGEELKKVGYVGYIDINCIANAKGIFPLEFTSRFGYPTISIQMEGITSDMGDFLYALARKEKCELKTRKDFQIGVVVAVPPWPYHDKDEAFIYRDLSILFKKPNFDGIHLGEVKLVNETWCVAGYTGYLLVVTASGGTVDEARKQVYKRVKNVILQNMYYRTDIGLRWHQDSDRLQMWGYLK